MKKTAILLSVALCLILFSTTAFATKPAMKSKGQIVIAGASYTDLSFWNGQYITTLLIIRNLDLDNSITLVSVDFYGPDGNLVKRLASGRVLSPLETADFATREDILGIPPYEPGLGFPYFLVEWEADKRVNAPAIFCDVSKVRIVGFVTEFLASSAGGGVVLKEK